MALLNHRENDRELVTIARTVDKKLGFTVFVLMRLSPSEFDELMPSVRRQHEVQ